MSIVVVVESGSGKVVAGPEIHARGFAEDETVFDRIKPRIADALTEAASGGVGDTYQLQQENDCYRRYLEEAVLRETRRVRHTFLSAIDSLVRTIEERDPYVAGHSARVRRSALLGRRPSRTREGADDLSRAIENLHLEVARRGTNGFHAFVARTGDDTFRGNWPLKEYRDDILYPVSFDEAGVTAQMEFEARGVRGQMKRADRVEAAVTLIVGGDELARGEVTVRNMSTGEQHAVSRQAAVETARGLAGESR